VIVGMTWDAIFLYLIDDADDFVRDPDGCNVPPDWGLRSEEVASRHLLALDIGLPVDQLMIPIRACLNSEHEYQEVTLHATNRRGRAISCRVLLSRLTQTDKPSGVILLMNELEASGPDARADSMKGNGV